MSAASGPVNFLDRYVRDVGLDAAWRSQPLPWSELLEKILDKQTEVNPLLFSPWINHSCFRKDWLHCADQGIGADFIGNFLWLLMGKMAGRTQKDRCRALWLRIQQWYEANEEVEDKLETLVPTMIKGQKKSPKLRASGAQARALIPFTVEASGKWLDDDDPVELAAKSAAIHINECYAALSVAKETWQSQLLLNSVSFAHQYVALSDHQGDGKLWKIKPKLHLFLELCAEGTKPSLIWGYRDEDFGGSFARFGRRRGGILSAASTSRTVLASFRMQPMVRLMEF